MATRSSSAGLETTKWMKLLATDGRSFSPTAPSLVKSTSIAAMKPTSPRALGRRLLQQPARLELFGSRSAILAEHLFENALLQYLYNDVTGEFADAEFPRGRFKRQLTDHG
jgi:hypothetical protein